MPSLVYQPSGGGGPIVVRQSGLDYTFMPGVPRHVPIQHLASLKATLQALQGNMVSPTPTVTPTNGAAATQSYQVVAYNGNGDTLPSATVTTAVGPTTLDGTHYNTVAWGAAPGASGYKVIRTAGGPSQGLIATLTGPILSIVDNGLAGTTYTPAGSAVGQVGVVSGPAEM